MKLQNIRANIHIAVITLLVCAGCGSSTGTGKTGTVDNTNPTLGFTSAMVSGHAFGFAPVPPEQPATSAAQIDIDFNMDGTFNIIWNNLRPLGFSDGVWSIKPDGSLELDYTVDSASGWQIHKMVSTETTDKIVGATVVQETDSDGSKYENNWAWRSPVWSNSPPPYPFGLKN